MLSKFYTKINNSNIPLITIFKMLIGSYTQANAFKWLVKSRLNITKILRSFTKS